MVFSPNPFLRPRAIEALASIAPEEHLGLFVELLHDNNVAVRESAIEALAPYRSKQDVQLALEAARDVEITERLRQRLEAILAADGRVQSGERDVSYGV
jgi:HEAT repeat protein